MSSGSHNPTAFKPGNKAAAGHGAPKDNANHQTHGLRTTTIAKLPCRWVQRQSYAFRRWLEQPTQQAHGAIAPKHELAINSATRHEAAALLIGRWLRLKSESMTHDERLRYVTALGKESDLRDKAIDRLSLDVDNGSILESLYASVTLPIETQSDPSENFHQPNGVPENDGR